MQVQGRKSEIKLNRKGEWRMKIGFLFGTALILDQITKIIVRHNMKPEKGIYPEAAEHIKVLGNFFRLRYIENPGIAFGIHVKPIFFFTALSILASVGIFVYLITHRNEGKWVRGGLALILGGACGNLIDRVLYKKVVDFIDIGFRDFRWPTFNLADTAVVIGMIILFYSVFITGKKEVKLVPDEVKEP
jgi:signal peptidase II